MDKFIEITGEGEFLETASRFIAEVNFAALGKGDQSVVRDVDNLRQKTLATLRKVGILDDEIFEGGTEYRRGLHSRKSAGKIAVRKIILKVVDFERLDRALEELEPLHSSNKENRKWIAVSIRRPEFKKSGEAKSAALEQAFEDARDRALRLAEAMNCRLGHPVDVVVAEWVSRSSGFLGDDEWGGRSHLLMAKLSVDREEGFDAGLQSPTRTISVKCRVRFAIDYPNRGRAKGAAPMRRTVTANK